MATKEKIATGATLEQRKLVLWGALVALNWGDLERHGNVTRHYYRDGFFRITHERHSKAEDKRTLTVDFKWGKRSKWEKVLKAEMRKDLYLPPSKILVYHPGIWENLLHLTYNNVRREEYIRSAGGAKAANK